MSEKFFRREMTIGWGRLGLTLLLTTALLNPRISSAQEAPKYKLTIIEDASTSKRAKKNRVGSQVVVQVSDSNNVPVPGIAVSFTIPQLTGSGASFTNGSTTTVSTTNPQGQATSSFTAEPGSTFNMGVAVSGGGGPAITATVPVTVSAAVAAGISTGVLVTILAVAGAAAAGTAVGIIKANGGNSSPQGLAGGSGPQGSVGAAGNVIFTKP